MRETYRIVIVIILACCLIVGAAACSRIDHRAVMQGQMERLHGFGRATPPPIVIDRAASELDISYRTWESFYLDRNEVLSALEQTWNSQAPSAGARVPARLSIKGSVQDNTGWIIGAAVLYAYWSLLGLPTLSSTARVEVTLEIQGMGAFQGDGSGSCYAGMYYPGAPSPCAFSKALTSAVRNAVANSAGL